MNGTANAALHRGLELDDTTHQPTAHDGHASRRQPRKPCPRLVDADHDRFPAPSSRGRPAEASHVELTPGSPSITMSDRCDGRLPTAPSRTEGHRWGRKARSTWNDPHRVQPITVRLLAPHQLAPVTETVRRCRRPWAARRVQPRALRAVPEPRRRPAAPGGAPCAPPLDGEAGLSHSPRSPDAILLPRGGPEHHAPPDPRSARREHGLTHPWSGLRRPLPPRPHRTVHPASAPTPSPVNVVAAVGTTRAQRARRHRPGPRRPVNSPRLAGKQPPDAEQGALNRRNARHSPWAAEASPPERPPYPNCTLVILFHVERVRPRPCRGLTHPQHSGSTRAQL